MSLSDPFIGVLNVSRCWTFLWEWSQDYNVFKARRYDLYPSVRRLLAIEFPSFDDYVHDARRKERHKVTGLSCEKHGQSSSKNKNLKEEYHFWECKNEALEIREKFWIVFDTVLQDLLCWQSIKFYWKLQRWLNLLSRGITCVHGTWLVFPASFPTEPESLSRSQYY